MGTNGSSGSLEQGDEQVLGGDAGGDPERHVGPRPEPQPVVVDDASPERTWRRPVLVPTACCVRSARDRRRAHQAGPQPDQAGDVVADGARVVRMVAQLAEDGDRQRGEHEARHAGRTWLRQPEGVRRGRGTRPGCRARRAPVAAATFMLRASPPALLPVNSGRRHGRWPTRRPEPRGPAVRLRWSAVSRQPQDHATRPGPGRAGPGSPSGTTRSGAGRSRSSSSSSCCCSARGSFNRTTAKSLELLPAVPAGPRRAPGQDGATRQLHRCDHRHARQRHELHDNGPARGHPDRDQPS